MAFSLLADILHETGAELIAGVEAVVSAATMDVVVARQTIARLPQLMRELVARLRADTERTYIPTTFQSSLDMDQSIRAARLLKCAVWDAIERQELRATPRELRIVADWFVDTVERELRAGYQRLSDTLDAVPDHMMVMGLDGRYRYLSRAASEALGEVLGVRPAEMVGQSVHDVIAASPAPVRESMQRHIAEVTERARRGEVTREELLLPHGDGLRWRERHVGPLRGPDGEVDAVAVASRDINDRKKAEARLQILSKLGALAETMEHDSILDAIAHLSIPELADWCLINVVEGARSPRTTLAHQDPAKATLAHELLRLPSQLPTLRVGHAALAGNSTLIVDIAEVTDDPELSHSEIVRRLQVRSAIVVPILVMRVPIAIATFMMTPDSGRRYGAEDLALAQEMARRAAQMIENALLHQQLRQTEARFRFALDHASISVFETDPELRFRWSYNSVLGLAGEQAIGQTLGVAVSREAGEVTDQLPRRVVETGEGARSAFSAIVDGRRRHFMVRYEPLRGVGGIVGLSGATIDVTELKEAEEQLARELTFRERMMGILGHDLRNPVSAVLGLTGLLLNGEPSDKARKQLGFIEQAARRMNEMIGTLLDFTRLRFHGSLPIALARIGLDELAGDVVAELRAAHRGREIELSTSGNLRGEWDPGRMAQLFTNLVANALTHGEKGSAVRVSLAGDEDNVVLNVSNRGAPISPALAERLFEPFKQGDVSDGGVRRGLGLGLFIVREIVRAHGGTIGVRSGDGLVTFTATFPRSAATRPDGVSVS
jgi:PAS domain S-box-containing protein